MMAILSIHLKTLQQAPNMRRELRLLFQFKKAEVEIDEHRLAKGPE
jgi:hypothetical protein